MAKTKKQQPILSPSKYIRLKARALPIAHCYVNGDWQESGLAFISVVRQHQSGNYTAGQYLVDTLCLGVKDTMYHFNMPPDELDDILELLPEKTEITYNEAHNIIFGAIAFAEEEAGISPHHTFELTQYLLEEDSDNIPLIDYEFGTDGKPFLAVTTRLEASKYLPILRKNLGYDVPFVIREEDYDDYEEDNFDENDYEEDEDFLDDIDPAAVYELIQASKEFLNCVERTKLLPHTTYAYVHPEYPATLELTHNELKVLYNEAYEFQLPKEVIMQLLALPRKSVIADLNHIILYELGKFCDTFIDDRLYNNSITHALFLLGELKASESLQVVLEILRQSGDFMNHMFGHSSEELFHPTLYYIGHHQTDALLSFMKEPGLNCSSRIYIFNVLVTIAIYEPERRGEVIEWFRQLLHFLKANTANTSVYDATLVGYLISELTNINAKELLPEIKEIYDTDLVDLIPCNDYPTVEKSILNQLNLPNDYPLPDIYQRYRQYEESWK